MSMQGFIDHFHCGNCRKFVKLTRKPGQLFPREGERFRARCPHCGSMNDSRPNKSGIINPFDRIEEILKSDVFKGVKIIDPFDPNKN